MKYGNRPIPFPTTVYRLPYTGTKIPEKTLKLEELILEIFGICYIYSEKITLTPIMCIKTRIPKTVSRQRADMGLIDYKWYFYNNGHSCLTTENSRATPIF